MARDSIKAGARRPRPAGYLLLFCAAAAKIKRVLLRLLTSLGVNRDLAYRYPAIVADVGTLDLLVLLEES